MDTDCKISNDYDVIYAMGDIHGDFNLLLNLLHFNAQVIDNEGKWKDNGQKVCVVLVGDTLDRQRPGVVSKGELEGEELLIHLFLNELAQQAKDHDSKIIKCLGNHEEMNIDPQSKNYSNYITQKGMALRKDFPIKRGSFFSKQIFTDNTYPFVIIDKYFFVHGGVGPITKDNKHLLKKAQAVMKKYYRTTEELTAEEMQVKELVTKMLWNRDFTQSDSCFKDSKKLQTIISDMGGNITKILNGHTVTVNNKAKRGHFFENCKTDGDSSSTKVCTEKTKGSDQTETEHPGIHYSCDKKIVRLDNGASRAFGDKRWEGRRPQLFKIDKRASPHKYSVIVHTNYLQGKDESFDTPISKVFDKAAIKKGIEEYLENIKHSKLSGGNYSPRKTRSRTKRSKKRSVGQCAKCHKRFTANLPRHPGTDICTPCFNIVGRKYPKQKRLNGDGYYYTYSEFIVHYGYKKGMEKWKEAGKAIHSNKPLANTCERSIQSCANVIKLNAKYESLVEELLEQEQNIMNAAEDLYNNLYTKKDRKRFMKYMFQLKEIDKQKKKVHAKAYGKHAGWNKCFASLKDKRMCDFPDLEGTTHVLHSTKKPNTKNPYLQRQREKPKRAKYSTPQRGRKLGRNSGRKAIFKSNKELGESYVKRQKEIKQDKKSRLSQYIQEQQRLNKILREAHLKKMKRLS